MPGFMVGRRGMWTGARRMAHIARIAPLCLLAGLLAVGASYATDVSGALPVWSAANSPYRVKGDVIVPRGVTLVIEPGVDVLFDADAVILVEGALRAEGTARDSIRFLPGESSVWRGIRIAGGDSLNVLQHARITGAWGRAHRGEARGGALSVGNGARLDVSHSVLEHNRADSSGGAIHVDFRARVRMLSTTLRDNVAWHGGGAHVFFGGSLEARNCVFEADSAEKGGAVFVYYSRAAMRGCVFRGNAAAHSGGAFYGYGTTTEDFVDCVFHGNRSDAGGGGIYVYCGGRTTVTRCVFSSNTSRFGGGAFASVGASTAEIEHATFHGNEGAVTVSHTARAYLVNSIVWGDGERPLRVHPDHPGHIEAAYCLVEGGWAGGTNLDTDPRFVDPANGDLGLREDSPCRDAGDPHRPSDPDGTRADMGAVRYGADGD